MMPPRASSEPSSSAVVFNMLLNPNILKRGDLDRAALLRALQDEYSTAYLEQHLDVSPTKASQALVHSLLPLAQNCLQIRLKARPLRTNVCALLCLCHGSLM